MPKGSTTRMPNGGTIPAGTPASRKRMTEWRIDLRNSAIESMGDREPTTGAVRLMCEFRLPYPTSSVRKYQLGWLPHTKKPDVDKLTRFLFDALTGIVWKDDSQVSYAMVSKLYAWDNKPGAHVIVDFLDDEWSREYAERHREVKEVMESL